MESEKEKEIVEEVQPSELKKRLIGFLKPLLAVCSLLGQFLSKMVKKWSRMSLGQQVVVLIYPLVLGALVLFARRILSGELNPDRGQRMVTSFEEVADQVFHVKSNKEWESFYESFRYKGNVILFKKVYINLRPSENSTSNPMAALEIYVEGSGREVIAEIQSRKKELRDVMSRIVEKGTYGFLRKLKGKTKLKMQIQRHFNQLLSQGRVRKVYFKSFAIKP